METKALLLTLFVSFFFLVGLFIPKLIHNKEKLIALSIGLTFIIMLFLIIIDLIPEIIEVFDFSSNLKNSIYSFGAIVVGFFSLRLLDLFIPEHTHEHDDKNDNIKEHNNHFYHIGFITAISLIVHNILEGISIYITGINDLKLGIVMSLTVGIHNLPLGIEVAASMEENKSFSKQCILFLLVFSSFVGAFLLFLIKQDLNPFIEGILLSVTLGMLIYISFQELLPEIRKNIKKIEIQYGILIGIMLSLLLLLL